MKKLYPMFNIVKLSTILDNLISKRRPKFLLLPIVIDKEEEWKVKEILDSCWHGRRFQFSVLDKVERIQKRAQLLGDSL